VAPKRTIAIVSSIALLAASVPAFAGDYRAGELLNLDLSKAVLSPKRIGPPAEFAPVPVQARTDSKHIVAAPKAAQRAVQPVHTQRQAHVRPVRRSNPLDAQAMDTRIQTWPCKAGGICNWKR